MTDRFIMLGCIAGFFLFHGLRDSVKSGSIIPVIFGIIVGSVFLFMF